MLIVSARKKIETLYSYMEKIREAYLDPEIGFSSLKVLAKRLGLSLETVKQAVEGLSAYQRNLPTKENRKKTTFKITSEPGSYQVDLVFMPYKKDNDNIVGFLLAIEITTRKAYMYPIRSKTVEDVSEAMAKLIAQTKPVIIQSDNEASFKSSTVQEMFSKNNIEHILHAPDDHNRMGIQDRMAKTIKDMLNKYFIANDTLRWIDVLPKLLKNYNSRPHGGLDGRTPNHMAGHPQEQEDSRAEKQVYNNLVWKKTGIYEVGDRVRVAEPLDVLEKGRPRFSDETYTIQDREGYSYVLRNANGNIIRRRYRPYELVMGSEKEEDVRVVDVIKTGRAQNTAERKLRKELGDAPQQRIETPRLAKAQAKFRLEK